MVGILQIFKTFTTVMHLPSPTLEFYDVTPVKMFRPWLNAGSVF
jgi:hypothetical protein